MNPQKREKINRFLNDELMSEAIYGILRDSFLAPFPPQTDINILAASRLSLQSLDVAWKNLAKYKSPAEEEKENTQKAL